MQWFRHDIGAFKDERIQALRIDCGGAAVDVYYAILELIYESEADLVMTKNQAETKSVLHWLCLGWDGFSKYVESMRESGLLSVSKCSDGAADETYTISSERATDFIVNYHSIAETARQNGKKGGRPRNPDNRKNPEKTQSVSNRNPDITQPPLEIRSNNKEKEVPKGTSKKKFTEPTEAEVAEYAKSRGCPGFDAARFCDHYSSNGWRVGKNPMKDWKATVRNWIRNDSKFSQRTLKEVADERYSEYNR